MKDKKSFDRALQLEAPRFVRSVKLDCGSITQHIPDKSFQLVRFYAYAWYSNKTRGQRLKRADTGPVDVPAGEVIDVSAFKPRRIPSKKWRELIKKVWEADPLLCPHRQHEPERR